MVEQQDEGQERSARFWASVAHLSALGGWLVPWLGQMLFPLLIWGAKRGLDPLVEDQAVEATNFGITMALVDAVVWIVLFNYGMELIFLLLLVTAFQSIFVIVAAIKAKSGVRYRYPICLRLL